MMTRSEKNRESWRRRKEERPEEYAALMEKKKRRDQAKRQHIREYHNTYSKQRRRYDPQFALANRLRVRLWQALNAQKARKSSSMAILLGCTVFELRTHLEALFAPGMTWENRAEWHIDHHHPLSKFDLTDPSQLAQACHYTNLKPMWASDNIRKGQSSP
mgnify:FL=1